MMIDRLKQKMKAEPHECEQIHGYTPRSKNRDHEESRAEHHETNLCRATEANRPRLSSEPAKGLNQPGRHENARRNRCKRPRISKPAFETTLWQGDIGPI